MPPEIKEGDCYQPLSGELQQQQLRLYRCVLPAPVSTSSAAVSALRRNRADRPAGRTGYSGRARPDRAYRPTGCAGSARTARACRRDRRTGCARPNRSARPAGRAGTHWGNRPCRSNRRDWRDWPNWSARPAGTHRSNRPCRSNRPDSTTFDGTTAVLLEHSVAASSIWQASALSLRAYYDCCQ